MITFLFALSISVIGLSAETNVVDGMKVVCEDGVCMLVEEPSEAAPVSIKTESLQPRIAHGYMDADTFIAFLKTGIWNRSPPLQGNHGGL
ncbi:MAG: hypothetical protein J6N18_14460 [Kiritimatiellae bacterium]|nr:hypothetical protein [Kiritimatiellia bacterium]